MFKINEQCFSNLIAINNSLAQIETRGESTLLLADIRKAFNSTLEQMKVDNQPKESEEEKEKDG